MITQKTSKHWRGATKVCKMSHTTHTRTHTGGRDLPSDTCMTGDTSKQNSNKDTTQKPKQLQKPKSQQHSIISHTLDTGWVSAPWLEKQLTLSPTNLANVTVFPTKNGHLILT